MGSPPQVRGKLDDLRRGRVDARITPAGAGKTNRKTRVETAKRGSPPQVRGKPGKSPKSGTGGRITPAGAGKTGSGAGCCTC